jgi:hypothetical protein
MPVTPLFSWLRKNWILVLIVSPFVILIVFKMYVFTFTTFFGYEVGSVEASGRLAERAIEKEDPKICNKIIYPSISMGPARYEFVNGCLNKYAAETGDVSVCMSTMSPGGCVTRVAKERDDASLCEQAIHPKLKGTDNRGSCFGYFANREGEYSFCKRLEELDSMNEHQKIVCMMLYVDSTGDPSHCSIHDNPDICYKKAAKISNNSDYCDFIEDNDIKKECEVSVAE